MSPDQLETLFEHTFFAGWNTRLIGGASEPEYFAAKTGSAEIHYREDYVRSALHEIAHWLVAGEARRQQDDYGYWYAPDGRSASQQREFFRVEVAPQAIEWLLSLAAGIDFEPSIDNLGGASSIDPEEIQTFETSLRERIDWLLQGNLSERTRLMLAGLLGVSGISADHLYSRLIPLWQGSS